MSDDPQDEDEEIDPRIEAGWRALDAGDVQGAREAAKSALDDEATRMDALLLDAACAREEDDVEGALATLERAAREDPDWCTPEMWMAELLATDTNRLGEALRHARRALDRAEEEDEYLAALACKAAIELELGRPTEARRTLKGLPAADVPLEDPLATLELAELLMDAGDPAEARTRLETLTAREPNLADAWYLLGAAAELQDDEDAKRAAWIKTRELDVQATDAADAALASAGNGKSGTNGASGKSGKSGTSGTSGTHGATGANGSSRTGTAETGETGGTRGGVDEGSAHHAAHGPHLSEERLIAIGEETLAELPEEVRVHLRNVPIVVTDLPAAADVATGLDPRILGLFSGTPHAHSGGVLDPPTLTEIILFRRNIERVAEDDEALRDEVRTTLLHEAGHFFGLDEEGLARLGLD